MKTATITVSICDTVSFYEQSIFFELSKSGHFQNSLSRFALMFKRLENAAHNLSAIYRLFFFVTFVIFDFFVPF